MKRGRDLPILWGNGRLLIGLVEVYEQTGDPKSLEAAKKLGDYFVTTDSGAEQAGEPLRQQQLRRELRDLLFLVH